VRDALSNGDWVRGRIGIVAALATLLLAATLAAAAAAEPARASGCAGARTSFGSLSAGKAFDAVLCIVNKERHSRGLNKLGRDRRLIKAATKQSRYQYRRDELTHTGPGGNDVADRVEKQGYRWRALGENVAWNYPSPAEVMKGWMASEGHCRNILSPDFTDFGFGFKTGRKGPYATQVFGAEPHDPAGSGGSGPQNSCPQGRVAGARDGGKRDPDVQIESLREKRHSVLVVKGTYDDRAQGRFGLRVRGPGRDPLVHVEHAGLGSGRFSFKAKRDGHYRLILSFRGRARWGNDRDIGRVTVG